MKKRLVAILTVICLAVSLSGCNFNINTNNPNPNDYEGPPDEFPSQQTSEADPFGGIGQDSGSVEFDFEAHNPTDWQLAYKDFLDQTAFEDANDEVIGYNWYFLADIDSTLGENIPELCVRRGTCEADYMLDVYSYNPVAKSVDEVIDDGIGASHTTFYVGPSGDLYSYSGHMGYLWVNRIEINNGKVTETQVFEQDINGDPDADYKSMSEIIGEDTQPCLTAPLTNTAALFWYINIPVATADVMDGKAADLAFNEALYGDGEVYACGDEFYTGKTGMMKFSNLLQPGAIDSYEKSGYEINMLCATDANFDGLSEMFVRLIGTDSSGQNNSYHFILLSFQDGVVYAYVLPNLSTDGGLIVCNYSVYYNWYFETYDYFMGIVFDKNCFVTFVADNNPKAQRPYVGTEDSWFAYDPNVEY